MGRGFIILLIVLLLFGGRWVAGVALEYQWWNEMGQVETWLQMLSYGSLPVLGAALVAFVALWVAHARGLKHAGTGLGAHPLYAKLSTVALLVLGGLVASATVESWTLVRWAGARGLAEGAWRDPVFGRSLSFYFFDLPFYNTLLHFVMGVTLISALVHGVTSRAWSLKGQMSDWRPGEGPAMLDVRDLNLGAVLESGYLRALGAVFFVGLAVSYWLDRFDLLLDDHGSLVGVDWVAENLTLPLLYVLVAVCVIAAGACVMARYKVLLLLPLTLLVYGFGPRIVTAVYVRPSEITIQRPYIERHIQATRSAYNLKGRVKEMDFPARMEAPIDTTKHKQLLDNVRLWDWRAFHDTVTQIQALRPYYVFHDSDVDRYTIDGQLRQLLVTPREIDVAQLPADARSRWINPHFIYTHGYGAVMAEAARITKDGLPQLLVQDAPPVVKSKSIKLTRPELYYGEVSHEPVFVRTGQPEFNYPSGAGNVETHYAGQGGFPISGLPMRLAAALSTGDWNILLTSYLKPESRMMVRRKIGERLEALAEFIQWDSDPYLVVTEAGRMVWMVDGYTTSDRHPYSRSYSVGERGRVNYIRNSVKATVDAYDGTVRLYAFDTEDPLLAAYRQLFPKLFTAASEMPADLRAHARYPELIFRLQAEVYRTYHMSNPEAFFNREDQWDMARNLNNPSGKGEAVAPTYVVATLPGSDTPEFLLMVSFTPRNKDNLIGVMAARCDGENLGEILFLQLSKQELIYGPVQIDSRISQDQVISKDLTLWNQQGSQVLRGQMLVLPVDNTVVYIEPIYIQASEARMPQLKKVVIAMGNRLIYADTYEQALAELSGLSPAAAAAAPVASAQAAPVLSPDGAARLRQAIESHLKRYRALMGEGKYGEAGREIEALERAGKER